MLINPIKSGATLLGVLLGSDPFDHVEYQIDAGTVIKRAIPLNHIPQTVVGERLLHLGILCSHQRLVGNAGRNVGEQQRLYQVGAGKLYLPAVDVGKRGMSLRLIDRVPQEQQMLPLLAIAFEQMAKCLAIIGLGMRIQPTLNGPTDYAHIMLVHIPFAFSRLNIATPKIVEPELVTLIPQRIRGTLFRTPEQDAP